MPEDIYEETGNPEDIHETQDSEENRISKTEKDQPEISEETIKDCNYFCSGYINATDYSIRGNTCYCYNNKALITSSEEFEQDEKIRWKHMPVTYSIINKEECGDYETRKIRRAFDRIQEKTDNIVRFKETEDSADIDVICEFIEDCYEYTVDVRREEGMVYKYETICEHAKGIAQITKTRGNSILKAKITMVGLAGFAETDGRGASGFYIGSCGHPTTEIHEILHVFNFRHKDDPDSIMYFQEDGIAHTLQEPGDCVGSDKEIDADIIKELKETYKSIR